MYRMNGCRYSSGCPWPRCELGCPGFKKKTPEQVKDEEEFKEANRIPGFYKVTERLHGGKKYEL